MFTSKQLAFEKIRSLALEGTLAERAAKLTTALVVALGLFLRARAYLFSDIPMGPDECGWAVFLLSKPLAGQLVRPIGFMALTKALAHVFSPGESVLRFLPWSAGIATVLMAPVLGAKLFRSTAARLLFVSVLALDPAAIDLSNEFNPSAIGLALHVALVLSTLRYCWSTRTRDLVVALALIGASVLFTPHAVFAYPGLFLAIAVEAYRGRRFEHLAAAGGTALVTAAVAAGLYLSLWSGFEYSKEERYWGKKDDVFYSPSSGSADNKTEWELGRYIALVEATGSRRTLWTSRHIEHGTLDELVSLDGVLWLVLHVVGLVVIVRGRRGRDALVLALPLGVMTACNWFGLWPQGPVRPNLFSLVYAAGIASFAFEGERRMRRFADLAPAALLVVLPFFVFEKDWHQQKEMRRLTDSSAMPDALLRLIRQQGNRHSGHPETLVMDSQSCELYEYYTKYHPEWSQKLRQKLDHRFSLKCSKATNATRILEDTRKVLTPNAHVWILASNEGVIKGLDLWWPLDLEKVQISRIGKNLHLVIGVEMKKDAEPPQPNPDESPPPL